MNLTVTHCSSSTLDCKSHSASMDFKAFKIVLNEILESPDTSDFVFLFLVVSFPKDIIAVVANGKNA